MMQWMGMIGASEVDEIIPGEAASAGLRRKMNKRIRLSFLVLIVLQGIYSAEEYIFRFYERFPPMRVLYENAPHLAKPAFALSNCLLVLIGFVSFYYWVRPARKGARTVVWLWIIIESFNVIAHLLWAVLIGGYNPGLVTGIMFVPVLAYLGYLMWRVPSYGAAELLIVADRL